MHLSEPCQNWRLCARRIAKQDFELHGRRIAKGSNIYVSSLYAKATDPRVSAGDHVRAPTPAHMDMRDLAVSFKPERWLGGELDKKAALATFGMGAHFCLGYPLYMQVTHKPPAALLCLQTEGGGWPLPAYKYSQFWYLRHGNAQKTLGEVVSACRHAGGQVHAAAAEGSCSLGQ